MPKFVTCHDIFLHFWNPSCGHTHVYSFRIPVYTILTCAVFLLSLALRMLHLLKWRLHGKEVIKHIMIVYLTKFNSLYTLCVGKLLFVSIKDYGNKPS